MSAAIKLGHRYLSLLSYSIFFNEIYTERNVLIGSFYPFYTDKFPSLISF